MLISWWKMWIFPLKLLIKNEINEYKEKRHFGGEIFHLKFMNEYLYKCGEIVVKQVMDLKSD